MSFSSHKNHTIFNEVRNKTQNTNTSTNLQNNFVFEKTGNFQINIQNSNYNGKCHNLSSTHHKDSLMCSSNIQVVDKLLEMLINMEKKGSSSLTKYSVRNRIQIFRDSVAGAVLL